MMRTDLAIDKKTDKNNIICEEKTDGIRVYKSLDEKEKHITIAFPPPDMITNSETLEKEIEIALKTLMPQNYENILVIGLGNTEITPDAIGPLTAKNLLATRHIKGEFSEKIGLKGLKSVSVVCPNVLGKTGIEAAELVKSIVDKIKPEAVIVIDALASSGADRLFRTVQLCNTGISPGSGVKNRRKEIVSLRRNFDYRISKFFLNARRNSPPAASASLISSDASPSTSVFIITESPKTSQLMPMTAEDKLRSRLSAMRSITPNFLTASKSSSVTMSLKRTQSTG